MRLTLRAGRRSLSFRDLNDLFAKANRARSGDRLAGLCAATDAERVAARRLLSEVTLAEIRARPALPPERDFVSRVVEEGLDEAVFRRHRGKTAGELRDFILGSDPAELTAARLGSGLTPEMAAAVAKLCSNLDLVHAAARIPVVAQANTTLGLPGRLGSRVQPNHPVDDVSEILAQTREGLSFGCGDALIGINPAQDDVATVRRLLDALESLIGEEAIPTQSCVLAHVTTQMKAIEQGARCGLVFQSLAGTEMACRAFGIDLAMLDEAAVIARESCTNRGESVLYFETGQGSELSSGCHAGVDQVTLEARCYGLARRYRPFAVNTVIGFIGPEYLHDPSEVARAGLEDHFMGKLLGVPMGVDACATNHMKGDQDDVESQALLLAVAGANYFMAVPQGDDVLLGYRSTSFHDVAALRETLGKRPAPEFEAWLEARGLMADGRLTARAGDPRVFRGKPHRSPVARIGIGRSGARPPIAAQLDLWEDLGAARDAVDSALPASLARAIRGVGASSAARDHAEFLLDPAKGRALAKGEASRLRSVARRPSRGRGASRPEVAIVVLSGLAARAVAEQAPPLLRALAAGLKRLGLSSTPPILVSRGRLKLADEIAIACGASIVVALVGDRPGLRTPLSMSAYVTEHPAKRTTDAERWMVSNIHATGLSPREAAKRIAERIRRTRV